MAFGQSIRFAKAFVEVGLDATEAQRGLRQFRNQFRSMRRIGIGVGSAMTAAFTPVVGIMAKATQEAARFEETINRFRQTFGRFANESQRFTDRLVKDLGQSREAMTAAMADFGQMLRRFGGERAASISQTLTMRAIDVASQQNRRFVDVQRDFMSMLAGSSEVVEKYGVNVKVAAVNQELLNNQIDPKQATDYQKTLARINILMRQTSQAQGDAARTQGSLTNQWRQAQNQIQNTLLEIGTELLPSVTQAVRDLNKALKQSTDSFKTLGEVGGVAARDITGGNAEVFGFTPESRMNRLIGGRQRYGEVGGRLVELLTGGGGLGPSSVFMKTQQLQRQSGRLAMRRLNREPENRSAQQPKPPPQPELPGFGDIGQGYLGTALGNLASTAGFRSRAFVRGMTRQFGPQIMDARRGLKEQIKGMRAVRDAQLRAPRSSHETFSVAAFGGDFTARGMRSTENVQMQLLEVNKEILDFIRNNNVVFG